MEAPPGFEPGIRALQARALPLGYGAVGGFRTATRHSLYGRQPAASSQPVQTGSSKAFRSRTHHDGATFLDFDAVQQMPLGGAGHAR